MATASNTELPVPPDGEMTWVTFEGSPDTALLDELYAFDAGKQATSYIKPGILPERVPVLSPAESPEELLHILEGQETSTCVRRDQQGDIVGYITVAPTTDYNNRTFFPRVARVLSIAAQRGHGGPLMKNALERLRTQEFTDVVLDVHPFNPAISFYNKHGFSRYSHGLQWLQVESTTEFQDMLDVHSNNGGPLTQENARITLFRYLESIEAWPERMQAIHRVKELNRRIGSLGLIFTLPDNEKVTIAANPKSIAEARHNVDVLLQVYMSRHPAALSEDTFSEQAIHHILNFVWDAGVTSFPAADRYLCERLGISMKDFFQRLRPRLDAVLIDEQLSAIPPARLLDEERLSEADPEFEVKWRRMVVQNYAFS